MNTMFVPAAPGFYLLTMCGKCKDGDAEKSPVFDLHVDKNPIVAWEINTETGDVHPIPLVGGDIEDDQMLYPDGTVHDGCGS